MSYTINKTDGTTLVTLKDGTIDTATSDVALFGKGYAGFGEKLNENFLSLLENFASTTAPNNKTKGQVWYDSSTNQLNVYTGTKWKPVGGSTTGTSQPTSAVLGDMWFDTTNKQLYTYSGTSWILIGPTSVAGSGVTSMVPEVVESNTGVNKSILKGVTGDSVVFVVSAEEFTPGTGTNGAALTSGGFATVYKGITLSTSISSNRFKGIASEAAALNDSGVTISASSLLRSDIGDTTSGTLGILNDSGLTVGQDSDVTVSVSGTVATIANTNGSLTLNPSTTLAIAGNSTVTGDLTVTGTLNASNTVSTSVSTLIVEDNMLVLNSTASGLIPSGLPNQAGIQVNRGADSAQNDAGPSAATVQDAFWVFDEQFADDGTTTYGNTGGAWTAYRSANQLRDKNLIDIRANILHGSATTASYADLAEKYVTDVQYEVGTVICVGGEHEATQSFPGCVPIGVISKEPAFLMNKDIAGQIVGLKGRVPVKVKGVVNKGDSLYVSNTKGVASKMEDDGANLVGIALENNKNEGIKLVECVLKV